MKNSTKKLARHLAALFAAVAVGLSALPTAAFAAETDPASTEQPGFTQSIEDPDKTQAENQPANVPDDEDQPVEDGKTTPAPTEDKDEVEPPTTPETTQPEQPENTPAPAETPTPETSAEEPPAEETPVEETPAVEETIPDEVQAFLDAVADLPDSIESAKDFDVVEAAMQKVLFLYQALSENNQNCDDVNAVLPKLSSLQEQLGKGRPEVATTHIYHELYVPVGYTGTFEFDSNGDNGYFYSSPVVNANSMKNNGYIDVSLEGADFTYVSSKWPYCYTYIPVAVTGLKPGAGTITFSYDYYQYTSYGMKYIDKCVETINVVVYDPYQYTTSDTEQINLKVDETNNFIFEITANNSLVSTNKVMFDTMPAVTSGQDIISISPMNGQSWLTTSSGTAALAFNITGLKEGNAVITSTFGSYYRTYLGGYDYTDGLSMFVLALNVNVDKKETSTPKTYTVTYTDGVAGKTVFPDQGYEGLKEGDATPAFVGGNPTSYTDDAGDTYTFQGWSPAVKSTVDPAMADANGNIFYTATWQKQLKDLTVTKTAKQGSDKDEKEITEVQAGTEFHYTIKVTNPNSKEVKVTITDKLDEKLDFVAAGDGGSYDEATRTVTWTNVTVPANGSKNVTVYVKANAPGEIKNTANITWDGGSNGSNETTVTVPLRITGIEKKLVRSADGLPVDVTEKLENDGVTITYPNTNGKITIPKDGSVTLLYKITVTGDAGKKFTVTDTGATWVGGPKLDEELTMPDEGKVVIYVTKTFTASDINAQGKLENIATVTPGKGNESSTSSTETTPAGEETFTYTLTYDANAGSEAVNNMPSPNPKTVGPTTAESYDFTVSDAVPTREGYAFKGWNDKADGSGTAYGANATITATISNPNLTLYAQWVENVTLSYDANGGQNAPASETKEKGSEFTVKGKENMTNDDKVFLKWNTKADGTGTDYAPSAELTLNENTTLYAIWEDKDNEYQLIYHANGENVVGTPESESVTDKAVSHDFTVSGTEPTREGYVFKGWNDEEDGTGTAYKADDTITATKANPTRHLYAQWEKLYTVTYSWTGLPEGSTETLPTEPNHKAGESVTVDSKYANTTEIIVGGKAYVFSGWSTSDVTIAEGKFTMPGKNVTISGTWTEKIVEPDPVDPPSGGDDDDDDTTPPSGGGYTPRPTTPPTTDVPVIDVPAAETPETPEEEIPEPEVPLAEAPEIPESEVEVPEEDVPLADIPKTGDSGSTLWAMLLALSAAGALALMRKLRREK